MFFFRSIFLKVCEYCFFQFEVKLSEEKNREIFGGHNWHEITMYYPMRYIRTSRYKLIHNINFYSPYPIDEDLYISPSFQDILNRTHHSLPTHWFKTLKKYYYRPEWELFDLKSDSHEIHNIYSSLKHYKIIKELKNSLKKWRLETNDPFICSPHSVLENTGYYKLKPKCLPLFNHKIKS